jgi:peptidoglycan/LPS O-acetylase OafA/YrhL
MDCLSAGAFLAWCEAQGDAVRRRFLTAAALAGGVLMAGWLLMQLRARPWMINQVPVTWLFGNTAMGLLFAAAVGRAARPLEGDVGALLRMRWLRYLGTISYGVYVVHGFVPLLLPWLVYLTPRFRFPEPYVNFTLSILLGAASWHLFEKPILGLKRFLAYPPPAPPAPAAEAPALAA